MRRDKTQAEHTPHRTCVYIPASLCYNQERHKSHTLGAASYCIVDFYQNAIALTSKLHFWTRYRACVICTPSHTMPSGAKNATLYFPTQVWKMGHGHSH